MKYVNKVKSGLTAAKDATLNTASGVMNNIKTTNRGSFQTGGHQGQMEQRVKELAAKKAFLMEEDGHVPQMKDNNRSKIFGSNEERKDSMAFEDNPYQNNQYVIDDDSNQQSKQKKPNGQAGGDFMMQK